MTVIQLSLVMIPSRKMASSKLETLADQSQ